MIKIIVIIMVKIIVIIMIKIIVIRMIKINLIRLRDVETIHGQHLEMIDLSGRLLGRLWHGYHLELFDRVFFFLSLLFLFSFNRFHHDDVEHTIERGSKLSVPLREAL